MNGNEFSRLAKRLLTIPTAPYHEHRVRSEVERICDEHSLKYRRDEFGNLIVTYSKGPKRRPVVFAAHMDHPGFEVLERIADREWKVRFCGNVAESYFRKGVKLRLEPGGVSASLMGQDSAEKTFRIESRSSVQQPPVFAVWDVEDFIAHDGFIRARACDDLIGVTAALATVIELKRSGARAHAIAALSRAEEVGFQGALVLAASGAIPRDSLVISLETSRELPGVKMGAGVILRVGDRASIFNSEATRYLGELAADVKLRGFAFQRALMSGGTCEATAYQEAGYTSAAVCIALGNYHNCGPADCIQAEYVNTQDAVSMVKLLEQAATQIGNYQALTERLRARLKKLTAEAREKLPRTAG